MSKENSFTEYLLGFACVFLFMGCFSSSYFTRELQPGEKPATLFVSLNKGNFMQGGNIEIRLRRGEIKTKSLCSGTWWTGGNNHVFETWIDGDKLSRLFSPPFTVTLSPGKHKIRVMPAFLPDLVFEDWKMHPVAGGGDLEDYTKEFEFDFSAGIEYRLCCRWKVASDTSGNVPLVYEFNASIQ